MRRLFGVILGVSLLIAGTSGSFAGIGIHLGIDTTPIKETSESFVFKNDIQLSQNLTSLNRQKSGMPLNVGVDLTFTMLPIVDLQVSVESAFSKYTVDVTSAVLNAQSVHDKSIPYLRLGADASALIGLGSFPKVIKLFKPFIGGGVSVHAFGPVVSRELLMDHLNSATEEIKPEDYVDIEPKFGFHLLFGTKIKPPAIPIGFRVTGKYYIFTGQEADTPENFLTVQGGIYLGG